MSQKGEAYHKDIDSIGNRKKEERNKEKQ